MSRRRMIIIVVLALAGTVVLEADTFVRRLAIQRTEEVVGGCVDLEDPTVDLGRYPVALRALRGHLDGVRFAADSADIAGIRLSDLRGEVRRVTFSVLGGLDDIHIDDADVSARVNERDLQALLDDLGLRGAVSIDDTVQIQLDGLPTTIRLDLDVDVGAVVVGLDGVLEPVLRLRFDVPGVTITRVDAAPGSLHVDATATGSPREVACTADRLLASRIRSLSRVVALLPGS